MNRFFLLLIGSSLIINSGLTHANDTPARIELQTNLGTIALELDYINTPITSANFVNYIHKNFYQNTLIHRVVKEFVIQGGGVDKTTGQFKTTDAPIINEASHAGSNLAMTISMARTSDPNSASSQFFINLVDNLFLNYASSDNQGYTVFGKVIKGQNVVKRIGNLSTYFTSQLPFTAAGNLVWIENVYTTDSVDPNTIQIRTNIKGSGKVMSDNGGMNCDNNCEITSDLTTKVTLKAIPKRGYHFYQWTGDCQGGNILITINPQFGNHNCTAIFNKNVLVQ